MSDTGNNAQPEPRAPQPTGRMIVLFEEGCTPEAELYVGRVLDNSGSATARTA